MYSFAQRSDTLAVDEPYYACYLTKTNLDHPGREEVLRSQSSNEKEVGISLFKDHTKSVLFIKNMAHHIGVLDDDSFLNNCINIFLIRNPKQIIASYAQVIESPVMRDIGIEYEHHLYHKLKQENPLVVDTGLLLENPESVIKQICQRVGLLFESSMLKWEAGPKSYDGVWAPYWYDNVHKSTGFDRQSTSTRDLPDKLKPLYIECESYYQNLLQFAIKP